MSALPQLRADSLGGRVRCSHCQSSTFETSAGVGPVRGCRGLGSLVHLGVSDEQDETKGHLSSPVTCQNCGTEHAASYEFPQRPPRQQTGG